MAKVADGIRYAERVVAGEIVAGEFVRLACQRFLDDLKYGEERGIYFSEPRAQHILNFYKFVPHVKGALAGQPIELMDWHVFILINIFGFVIPLVNEETGEVVMRSDGSGRPVMVRRFRTAYNEVARKNAKSTLSSGIGLYMTGADGEGGAEVYSAATTRDQARIVFEDAKNMVRKARSTLGRLFDFNKLAIYQEQSASKFEPLSSDANNLDGLNIHCAIIDELHAHKTRDVWDVLETATGARLQSLLFGITTAGFNKEGICYEQRDYAIKVLRGYNSDVEGAVKDDSYFAIIYTLDEGDDPFDETVWQKANPGLGICKRWDDLRRLAKKAKEQVSARVNGAVTSGVLRTEQTLSDQAYERLKKDFEERHTGLGNAHRPMILEMGLDWKSMALNAEDSQFLETRKFQLEEICRLFRVPLHMVQNTDRATFNNIEELGLGFINYSLVPYLTRIEQRINTGLVRKSKQGVYYAKFNAGALLRGDMKSRFEAYATGINWGIYSPNDCRDLEDMNPRPGGDVYLTPMNMTTKPSDGSKAGKQKDNANADETTS
ncbi:phage portal protein [Escherichia coli]|nr:phage portal protein [Escherichia coli]MDM4876448.1 phage portal protein [Escherichia coli]